MRDETLVVLEEYNTVTEAEIAKSILGFGYGVVLFQYDQCFVSHGVAVLGVSKIKRFS